MATRKHNEFLDVEQSDEDGSQGYDSEIDGLKKGGRSPKRRKVETDVSDDEQPDQDANEKEIEDNEGSELVKQKSQRIRKAGKLPGLSKKKLDVTAKAVRRSGVVYLSRVPPFMKPATLRSLLEPYGAINRIFLTPEDPASHTRRVRNGGNKKRSFVDGWIEFLDKEDAQKACDLLNGRVIGGKKGTYYHDDIWNLKYLRGFKWNKLTEQIAAENAEKASRMRAEISKTTKENKEFVQNVERAKMLEGMESKNAAKRRKESDDTSGNDREVIVKERKRGRERPRIFEQLEVAKKKTADQPEQVKRALSKIFG
jgi:ESF2/ABP1 family protein